jgi:hypothetical protein
MASEKGNQGEEIMAEAGSVERTKTEMEVLEKFGLRYSILAAWYEELSKREVGIGADVPRNLELVRAKLGSGCFSSCEIGCDLSGVEGALVSEDGKSPAPSVDFWLGLLGEAMSESPRSEEILRYPPIKFHYQSCGFLPCGCRGLPR